MNIEEALAQLGAGPEILADMWVISKGEALVEGYLQVSSVAKHPKIAWVDVIADDVTWTDIGDDLPEGTNHHVYARFEAYDRQYWEVDTDDDLAMVWVTFVTPTTHAEGSFVITGDGEAVFTADDSPNVKPVTPIEKDADPEIYAVVTRWLKGGEDDDVTDLAEDSDEQLTIQFH